MVYQYLAPNSDTRKLKDFKLRRARDSKDQDLWWQLCGTRFWSGTPITYTIAASWNKEELIVWADMNNIKIEELQ